MSERERNYEITLQWIAKRNVSLEEIADLTLFLQTKYIPELTKEECLENIKHVLEKREVQNAVLTGIQLDILAEEGKLIEPLQSMVFKDSSLYGIDEILSCSILNVYGSIGLTNYGYIDRIKPGVLKRLDSKNDNETHTFMDDLVGAIAAAAASRIAHNYDE